MKTIDILYKRFGITHNQTTTIPTRWDELSAAQLVLIARNYMDNVDETEMLAGLLGIKQSVARMVDPYQRFCLARELGFMDDFRPHYAFVLKTVKKLSAPRPRLEGMTFGQFMFVDTYYEKYLQYSELRDLDKFIACLYLPEGKQFEQEFIDYRADYVQLFLLHEEKTAISLNYRLVKEWICERYPLLFRKPKESQEQNATVADPKEQQEQAAPVADPKAQQGSNWVRVFESLVADDIVNQDKYANLPVHFVFRYLTQKLKENGRR